MNNHYTGYELEVNHRHEVNIRRQFERQALAKSLNEIEENEGFAQMPKRPWRRVRSKRRQLSVCASAALV